MNKKRVVITGLGVVSPVGNAVNEFWKNIQSGKNGIAPLENIPKLDELKVKIGAQVKGFDPEAHGMTRVEAKRMDKYSQFAVAAAYDAHIDAGLDKADIDVTRYGCIIGAGIGGLDTLQDNITRGAERGYNKIKPMFIPMCIPNAGSGNAAIKVNAQGHNISISTACAAGTQSIGEAYNAIQLDYIDVAVTGGAEASANESGIAGFAALTALNATEDINNASIPFSEDRAGFVIGEGSGVMVVEELEHAKKRGAKIYAEILGYGSSCDAHHITAPDGIGGARAMKMAVERSGIKPEEVDYINAHGTSTPLNDKFETNAIKDTFGEHAYELAISSTKSMTGHCLGAAGGIEAIISVLALRDGVIPPTINLNNPDPELDLNYTPNKAVKKDIKIAMSNSLGFGGHNGVIVMKKWEG